jgi:hypothetical protein
VEYLLIAFIIVVVLSPLAWLRSTPGQARVTAFRRRATELGLKVQIVPPPDAPEGDSQPTAVFYCLSYPQKQIAEISSTVGQWTLLRKERRGWESRWQGWRWFRREGSEHLSSAIEGMLQSLPGVVYAVRADKNAVGVFLRESGEVSIVDDIANTLNGFIKGLG